MDDLLILVIYLLALLALGFIAAGVALLYTVWQDRRFRSMAVPMKRIRFFNID